MWKLKVRNTVVQLARAHRTLQSKTQRPDRRFPIFSTSSCTTNQLPAHPTGNSEFRISSTTTLPPASQVPEHWRVLAPLLFHPATTSALSPLTRTAFQHSKYTSSNYTCASLAFVFCFFFIFSFPFFLSLLPPFPSSSSSHSPQRNTSNCSIKSEY